MTQALHIAVLSDGKPGHRNQSLGLAEAIARRLPAEIETIDIARRQILPPSPNRKPDLILGAGHSVHLPMVLLAKRTGARSIVLMKPSLPLTLFDLCIIPQHDLEKSTPSSRVIPTVGALNRLPPPTDTLRNSGLILLGGPSSHHGWNAAEIESRIQQITKSRTDSLWRITDSRRTPDGTLERLARTTPSLEIHPHSSTGPDWLTRQLTEAIETWVSEDSVSMIYEALSSGTRVGLLPVPRKNKSNRIIQGIDRLIEKQQVTPFDQWDVGSILPESGDILREADRVADLVIARFHSFSSDHP